jgi:hypothetical protein
MRERNIRRSVVVLALVLALLFGVPAVSGRTLGHAMVRRKGLPARDSGVPRAATARHSTWQPGSHRAYRWRRYGRAHHR